MPTPSIRLSENVRRAVRNSKYSIGDLAREGIEQALMSDYVGVCWLCGEAIHRQEQQSWIDQERYSQEIAHRNDIRWPLEQTSGRGSHGISPSRYQDVTKYIKKEVNVTGSVERYHDAVSNWLAIPDVPVELCADCTGYLQQIKQEEILPTELPIPYLFRQYHRENIQTYPGMGFENPLVAYAADSAAVWAADYISYQQRNGEEVFAWAARNRQHLQKKTTAIWPQIAKKSHAHRLGWRNPLQPTFKMSLKKVQQLGEWIPDGFDYRPPGLPQKEDSEPRDRPYIIDEIKGEIENYDRCAACGTSYQRDAAGLHQIDLPEFCAECFYVNPPCSECSDQLKPTILDPEDGLHEPNLTLQCVNCGETAEPPEEYKHAFIEEYKPILESMAYAIPLKLR